MTVTTPKRIEFDGYDTVVRLWADRCRTYGERTAHRVKKWGVWQAHSWREYYESARLIGQALIALGVKSGEPVLILSEDRREWLYADLGAAAIGAIPSGVYTTDSAMQLSYLANDSGATVLFVENDEQLDKFLSARGQMPGLQHVVVFDRDGLADFSDDAVLFLDELLEIGKREEEAHPGRFERALEAVRPEDPRMLIYTSGTTGPSKGAIISHRNVIFQLRAWQHVYDFRASDDLLCFLPLCHALERLVSVENPIAAGCTVNFAESPETVLQNLQEVNPHTFAGVPRMWEKIHSRVVIMRKDASWIGRRIFDWAINCGAAYAARREDGRKPGIWLAANHAMADILVLSNLRRVLGFARARQCTTGAAPISPEVIRWFNAIGVPLVEGWGLTECSGVGTTNVIGHGKLGTVGTPVPGVEIRLAADGEIQIGGPTIFSGYWKKPEKTAETLTEDGWLKTGDVGRIDNQGFVTITGRIKDIIITAGGKNITPAEIESRLKFSPYISDAVVIGDRRKYLTCLIMIDHENVEKYAQDNQIPFSDYASLTRKPEIQSLVGSAVTETNRQFAQVEQIKDFRLIDILLTPEDEELTPTMKLKRSFVSARYSELIESMY